MRQTRVVAEVPAQRGKSQPSIAKSGKLGGEWRARVAGAAPHAKQNDSENAPRRRPPRQVAATRGKCWQVVAKCGKYGNVQRARVGASNSRREERVSGRSATGKPGARAPFSHRRYIAIWADITDMK